MPTIPEEIKGSRTPELVRKRPGRPRAIPEALAPKVISLHRQGFGYRATARELLSDGLCVDWSTVRRLIKANQAGLPLEHHPRDL
jgi:hypothetical protein